MRLYALLLALTCALAAQAVIPLVPDSIRARFAGRHTAPVEGVWYIADGSTLLIESDGEGFAVTRMYGTDLRLRPYTLLGRIHRVDLNGHNYSGSMATDVTPAGTACKPHDFIFTVGDEGGKNDGRMTITPQQRLKFDIWLLWRMLFTVSVRRTSAPKHLHAIRLFPDRAITPDFPVVL